MTEVDLGAEYIIRQTYKEHGMPEGFTLQRSDDGMMRYAAPPATDLGELGTDQVGVTPEGRPMMGNPDGSYSTERSITVDIDGQFYNIPSMYGGKEVSPEEAKRMAIENGLSDVETGREFTPYGTVDEAVAAAQARSDSIERPTSLAGYIGDIGQGLLGGAARGAHNINKMIPGAAFIEQAAGEIAEYAGLDTSIDQPTTMPGQLASGLGQALPGMIPAMKALKMAGYGPAVVDILGGVIGDFATSGKTEADGIAELIGMIPGEKAQEVSQIVSDFVTNDNASVEDFNARLVGALPGAILGPVVGGLGTLVRMAKNSGAGQDILTTMKSRFDEGKSPVPLGMSIEDVSGTYAAMPQGLADLDTRSQNAWLDEFSNAGVKGSTDVMDDVPLSFNNKPVQEWSPQDFEAAGDELGIERLGPLSSPSPLKLDNGKEINIPGGLDGKFTYYDMLTIKSQGIDASRIPESVHARLQEKMSRSLMLDNLTDEQVWAGLAFGMTSPNNPLFPNQLAMSRLRGNEAIDNLVSAIDWNFGDDVAPAIREAKDKEIAAMFGLNKGADGGLGVRGTQNYTRVAEMAKLFKENPGFFRRRDGEEWPEFAERVFSQVAGLKAKTGSFSIVFQDPLEAGVSAIDRHMGQLFKDKILADPAERLAWQDRAISLYNSRNAGKKGKKKVVSMGDLPNGFVGEMILSEVGKTSSPLFRTADGKINPALSSKMRNTDWIREPKNAELMGEQYKAALQANQEEALKHGLGIFSSQWMLWDRMRRRLEPHENMFPGLEKMPRMSVDQARLADDTHRGSGHKDYTKEVVDEQAGEFRLRPTKYVNNPAKLAYFAFPGAFMLMQGEEE